MSNILLTGLAADVDTLYDNPVAVAVVAKTSSFPTLQELGYNGQLSFLAQDFHGLKDFKNQMTAYSSSNNILTIAWNLIKNTVMSNFEIIKNLFVSPSMGTVGKKFLEMVPLTQLFAVQAAELNGSTAASVVASNLPSV